MGNQRVIYEYFRYWLQIRFWGLSPELQKFTAEALLSSRKGWPECLGMAGNGMFTLW